MSYVPADDEITAANRAHLADVIADSQAPCDCEDCDGRYCHWCLTHHFQRACPFVAEVREEMGL